jgi:hypothetical protein
MTTRETLVKELQQLKASIEFNSTQRLKLIGKDLGVGTVVANKDMILLEEEHARLLRRRDGVLRSLEVTAE